MTELSIAKPHHPVPLWIPGLLLTAVIAGAASWLAQQPMIAALGLGSLTLAIMLGILVGNSIYSPLASRCDNGVLLAKQKLLRLGIILFGFRITLQQIADVGFSGILIDALTLTNTFLITCLLGMRLLKLDRDTVWLIGAGSSICGGTGDRAGSESRAVESCGGYRDRGAVRHAGDLYLSTAVAAGA